MIQRWTAAMGDFEAEMWRDEGGSYVRFEDHAQQVKALRDLLLDWMHQSSSGMYYSAPFEALRQRTDTLLAQQESTQ